MNVWTDMSDPDDNIFLKLAGLVASIWAFPVFWMEHKPPLVRIVCMVVQIPWCIVFLPFMLLFVPFVLIGIAVEMYRESA